MRKSLLGSLAVFVLCCAVGFGQTAEKAAAASSVLYQFTTSKGNAGPSPEWTTLLRTSIKPPGGKDLFITFSAQTGLFTTSSNVTFTFGTYTLEDVAVQVRCLLNGTAVPISPGSSVTTVTFDNLVRSTTKGSPADVLDLVVNQGGAHSFTWIARDVGVSEQTVDVQARFLYTTRASVDGASVGTGSAALGSSSATSSIQALIGPQTLIVEQVKLK